MVESTEKELEKAVIEITEDGITINDFVPLDDESKEKFNPHHVPAGVPEGGQFTTAPGVGAFSSIAGSGEWEKEFDEFNKERIKDWADFHGITVEEYKQRISENLQALVDNNDIALRIHPDDFEFVMIDGKFKNQHESGQSGGFFDPDNRLNHEDDFFGEDTYSSDAERPIYGYLKERGGDPNEFVRQYGSVSVILKDSIRDRTTITVSDSMDMNTARGTGFVSGEVIARTFPSNVNDVNYRSHFFIKTAPFANINREVKDPLRKNSMSDFTSYVELQFHGGVHTSDIANVIFSNNPPSQILRNKLDVAGIPWTYEFDEFYEAFRR